MTTAHDIWAYLTAHYLGRMQAPGWVPASDFGDYVISVVRRYDNSFSWYVVDRRRAVAKGRHLQLAGAWWAGCEAIAADLELDAEAVA